MGTLIYLYHHPEPSRIVHELNERNRRWRAGDDQGYAEMGKALDIQKDTHLPRGVQEIFFQSKKHPDLYPTSMKVGRLGSYLEGHRMTPLNAIFGYPSWEPEDRYLIPGWDDSYGLIQADLLMFGASRNECRNHLEAFAELVQWVIDQDDWASYFLGWSY